VFFAALALLLAGIGLYGVLDYSVVQRRREIGIRIAIGSPAARVARIVISELFAMVACGAVLGSGLGILAARYVNTLLYAAKPGDSVVLVETASTLLLTAAMAAMAPVMRAVTTAPAAVLKAD
jgi:putative ABC transport system permease protein